MLKINLEWWVAFGSKMKKNVPLKWIKEGMKQKQDKNRFPVDLLNDPIARREKMSHAKSVECPSDKL